MSQAALSKKRAASFTPKDFAETHRLSLSYVYKCCSGQKDRLGREMELPEGWQAEKVGRTWLIKSTVPSQPQYSEEETFVRGLRKWMALDTRLGVPEPFTQSVLWVKHFVAPSFPAMREERKRLAHANFHELQDGKRLLRILALSHQMSCEGKWVRLELSFSGKGLWNVKLIAPRDEPIFSSLIASSAQARKAVHLWLDEVEDLLDGVARQKKGFGQFGILLALWQENRQRQEVLLQQVPKSL